MKKVFVILLLLLLILGGLYIGLPLLHSKFPTVPSGAIRARGILDHVTGCMIPEGCGTEFKLSLSDLDYSKTIDLAGNLDNKNSGLLVEIIGIESTFPAHNIQGVSRGVMVLSYKVLSKTTLGSAKDKSLDYMLKKYGCICSSPGKCDYYQKSYSWKYEGNPEYVAEYTIGLTNITLVYDGNTGQLNSETIDPPEAKFCSKK